MNAPVVLSAGEILENSIRINELVPKKSTVDASYILIGAAKNKNNELYIAQFVVNRASNEVTSVDVLYAVNAKTGLAGSLSPEVTGKPATLTNPTISISELLGYVNKYFPDILPESVLKHFGHSERPSGELGKSALYSTRDENATDSRTLLANALESTIDTSTGRGQIEAKLLGEYKDNIAKLNEIQARLTQTRAEIKELSFSKGKRDTARLKVLKDEAIKDANRISVYDKKLLRLESTAPLKELLNREKSAAERKAKAAGKAALEAYKTSAAAQLQSVKDAYKQKTTSRKETELRHKISGIAEDFRQRLLGKSGSKYVPRELVGGVVDICEAIGLMFNFSRIIALQKVNVEHKYILFFIYFA